MYNHIASIVLLGFHLVPFCFLFWTLNETSKIATMNRRGQEQTDKKTKTSKSPQSVGWSDEHLVDHPPSAALSMTALNKFHVRRPAELKRMKPEMLVSKNVVMKADLKFHNLLRVEGTVEGKIIAPPDAGLVLCSSGIFLGDICGLGIVYVDGKVKGNIFVDHLGLGPNAQVHGNIFCKRIEVAGSASIIGQLLVNSTTQLPTSYIERAQQPLVAEQSDSDDDDDNGSCKSLGNSPQRPKQRQTENSPGLEGLERDDSIDKFPAADDADINDGDDRDSLQQEMPTEEEKNEMDEEPPVKVEKEDKRRRSRRNNKDVTETVMIIHEPQVDFYPGGNWYTKGVSSDDSISRLAKFILENVQKIDRLVVIMDVHQNINPRQSLFWENIDGDHPPVGTVITIDDIMSEKWTPTENISQDEVISWFDTDTATGDVSTIIIQPKHGQLGGPGAAIVPQLHEAISEWSDIHKDEVQYVVSKVASSKEEKHNYRALLHEDQYDLFSTFSNISKISKVLLAGQYQSHCRQYTIRHIAEDLILSQQELHGIDYNPESVFILTDGICFSPSGFEVPEESSEYIHELNQLGYTLTTTDELVLS